MKLYFKILIFFVLSINFSAYSQTYSEKLNNSSWYTSEGIRFRFNDSTINFSGLNHYGFFSNTTPINWEDSTFFFLSKYVSDDSLLINHFKDIIAKVTYTKDSLIMRFDLNRILYDSTIIKSPLNYSYYSYFKDSILTLYSSEKYSEIKGQFNLMYFRNSGFYVDQKGNILYETSGVEQWKNYRTLDGVYKGRLTDNVFLDFKKYIADSLISLFYSFETSWNCDDCVCNYYFYETNNLIRRFLRNCNFPIPEPNLNLSSFLYSDSAWIENDMKFYGYDVNNKNPLAKQKVYDKHEDYTYIACSGKADLKKVISHRREKKYIYKLDIDSIYADPRTSKFKDNSKLDSIYFISEHEIKNIEQKGFIINSTFVYNGNPVVYLEEKYKRTTSFFELIDTFLIDINYIFMFNKYNSSYLIEGHPYESNMNYKISREILKLQGKYYY